MTESNSYKRSSQEELKKSYNVLAKLNILKGKQNSLRNSFQTYFEKNNTIQQKHLNLLKIIKFEEQNLNKVMLVCI